MAVRTTISGNEVLDFIIEKCAESLTKSGIAQNHASRAALDISDQISEEFGGQLIYFRKNTQERIQERNLDMMADIESGEISHSEIARKYGVSIQSVYGISKKGKL